MHAVLAVLLALAPPPPVDGGSGSGLGQTASYTLAGLALGVGLAGGPLLAHQQGFSWGCVAGDQLGGAVGFAGGLALAVGLATAPPYSGKDHRAAWTTTLLLAAPPLLAEAGLVTAEAIATGRVDGRAVGGSLVGLVAGAALGLAAVYLGELLPSSLSHSMLLVLGIGVPLTIGGAMTAGAAVASRHR